MIFASPIRMNSNIDNDNDNQWKVSTYVSENLQGLTETIKQKTVSY